MEIYHRDHWIIIIYLTTWNDLNMGIEENKLTDLVIREDCDVSLCAFSIQAKVCTKQICASDPWANSAHQMHGTNQTHTAHKTQGAHQTHRLVLVFLDQSWSLLVSLGHSWSVLARLGLLEVGF